MADFDFKVGFDASEVISGASATSQSLNGMESAFQKLIADASHVGVTISNDIAHLGDGATSAGEKIASGINGGLNNVQHKFDETKAHGEGFIGSLQEKFGELGGLLLGGGIASGAALGLEKLFESGEKRIKSLEDQRTALLQSGVAEQDLGTAQAASAVIVDSLSEKYAKNKEDVRALTTQIAGLGGISVDQTSKVAEIGLAFDQIGVPMRSFKQLLAGAGGPESAAALDTIKTKFPAIATAIEGASTAGEKVDAIFKGLTPTLKGMEDAANGPLGAIEKIKNQGVEILGTLGSTLIEVVQPVTSVLLPVLQVAGEAVTGLVGGIKDAFEPIGEIFASSGGSASSFKDILKTTLDVSLLPVKLSIEAISLATHGLIDGFNAAKGSLSDIGNFLGLVSDADNANTHATETVHFAKEAYDEYAKSIEGVNAEIASADGIAKQVADLDSLLNKTTLTTEEQKKLSDLQAELGSKFPETTTGVNAQTGAFTVSIEKLKELSAEQKKAADASFKENLNKNVIGPMGDLIPAIAAQKAKLAELRESLDKANASGDRDKILETREAYLKQTEAIKGSEDQLKKNVTVLVENKLVGTGSAEDMAKAFHTTADKVASLVPIVASVNQGLKDQANAAKEAAESVSGLAKAFDDTKKAADAAKAQSISALAEEIQKRKEIKQQVDDGVITEQDGADKLKKIKEDTQGILDKGLDDVAKSKDLADSEKEANKELGLVKEKNTKTNIDLVGLAEAQLKLAVDQQKLELLKADNGKLTLADQIKLLETEKAGQPAIEAALQAEVSKLEKLKQTVEVKKKLIEAQDKEVQFEQKILETTAKIREEQEKLAKAAEKIVLDSDDAAIALLKVAATADDLGSVGKVFTTVAVNADIAKQQFAQFRDDLGKKPEGGNLLTFVDQFFDKTTAKLKDGLSFDKFKEGFNELPDVAGIDSDKLLAVLASLSSSVNKTLTGARIDSGALGLDILGKELEIASAKFISLHDEIAKKPEATELLGFVDKFFEKTGQLKAGLSITDFTKGFTDLAAKFKDVFASLGIDPAVLLKGLTVVSTATVAITKDTLAKQIAEEKLADDKINNIYNARAFLISESGLSEVDKVRLRVAAETDQYNELHAAAVAAHDTKEIEKLDKDYAAKKLKGNEDLFKAEKKQFEDSQKNIKDVLASGFSAAFGILNKSLFDPIDKALNASTNVFGAFASGAIKHLVDIGEQALANLAEGAIASAITGGLITATMATIEAAAAPAAFAVAVASFGTAADIALAQLGAGYAAFQGLLSVPKLESGTVISSPTLTLIGEKFEDELVLPMKTAKEFLAEAAGGVIGGKNLTAGDLEVVMNRVFQNNPVRGEISGYNLKLLNDSAKQRLVRRGA